MIEVTVYGKIKVVNATVQFEIQTDNLIDLETTVRYFLQGLMAKSVAIFSTVDTIMLSNHDSGYVNSWSVIEEVQDSRVAVKYIEFVVDDIMNWVDISRDKETEKILMELIANGCSINSVLDAITQKGYNPMFASYWVAAHTIV